MPLPRTLRFIFGFLILIILGLYSLNYSQGRVGYAGPVIDTSLKGSVRGASAGDAWSRITNSFTPLPDQAEKIAQSKSITDTLARDAIDLYLQARERAGGEISPEERDRVVGSAAAMGMGYIDLYRYTSSDVLLSPSDSVADKKTYANALATAIDKNFAPIPKQDPTQAPNELALFQNAVGKSTLAELKKLEPYRKAYAGAVRDLLLIRVPSTYANTHLDMVNSFATSEEGITRMMQFETDPLGAMYGVRAHMQEYARGSRVVLALRELISKDALTFSENEPAHALLRITQFAQ